MLGCKGSLFDCAVSLNVFKFPSALVAAGNV